MNITYFHSWNVFCTRSNLVLYMVSYLFRFWTLNVSTTFRILSICWTRHNFTGWRDAHRRTSKEIKTKYKYKHIYK